MRNVRKVPMPVLEHTMNISVYFGVQLIQYTLDNVAQRLKRLPAMWETRVQSLGWEDPPETEIATHSSTLAWRSPWREEPGRLQSTGLQRVGHD